MATDRDEQQRQQQELEEIRRNFAETGARIRETVSGRSPEKMTQARQEVKLLMEQRADLHDGLVVRLEGLHHGEHQDDEQQDHRQRDLRDDERFPHARRAASCTAARARSHAAARARPGAPSARA